MASVEKILPFVLLPLLFFSPAPLPGGEKADLHLGAFDARFGSEAKYVRSVTARDAGTNREEFEALRAHSKKSVPAGEKKIKAERFLNQARTRLNEARRRIDLLWERLDDYEKKWDQGLGVELVDATELGDLAMKLPGRIQAVREDLEEARALFAEMQREFKEQSHQLKNLSEDGSVPVTEEPTFEKEALDIWRNTRVVFTEDQRFEEAKKIGRFGDYPRALEIFSQVLASNPFYVQAYTYSGLCHYRLGQYASAAWFVNKAISMNENEIEARRIRESLRLKGF